MSEEKFQLTGLFSGGVEGSILSSGSFSRGTRIWSVRPFTSRPHWKTRFTETSHSNFASFENHTEQMATAIRGRPARQYHVYHCLPFFTKFELQMHRDQHSLAIQPMARNWSLRVSTPRSVCLNMAPTGSQRSSTSSRSITRQWSPPMNFSLSQTRPAKLPNTPSSRTRWKKFWFAVPCRSEICHCHQMGNGLLSRASASMLSPFEYETNLT